MIERHDKTTDAVDEPADEPMTDRGDGPGRQPAADEAEPMIKPDQKKVFLVAAFRSPDRETEGPLTGMAEDVVAVMGMEGDENRFAWVGIDQADSIANPAMVTPVRVRLAVPSPWHPDGGDMLTGLVQLAPEQLGTGPVADDIDHLLAELATSRARPDGPTRPGSASPGPASPSGSISSGPTSPDRASSDRASPDPSSPGSRTPGPASPGSGRQMINR
ncbi:MAG: hypothetical protein AAF531_10195 [Actinomycetota bacterium]